MLTVGDCFAGIGGFSLAATRVFGPDSVRFQIEIDPWCRRVLAKNFPDVPRFSDIREVTGSELPSVDLFVGGPPCQPVAEGGKRLAGDDPRWLWPEWFRIVRALHPPWIVAENVPGLERLGLDEICAELEMLGYEVGVLDLPAACAGSPHLRHRLWILAHADRSHKIGRNGSLQMGREPVTSQTAGAGDTGGIERCAQPGVGGVIHGLPGRLDGITGWPARPEGVPIVRRGVRYRAERVGAMGNAIVPQVAEFLFRRIQEVMVSQ